jgi:hypothetical protein
MTAGLLAAACAAWTLVVQDAAAPAPTSLSIDGYVGVLADGLPRKDAIELRPTFLIDVSGQVSRLRFRAEAAVEGLVARRGEAVTHAAARARDIWLEVAGTRAELRVGYGRVIWGRLDEIQPSDVINPLDTARFLLEGRSEARLPVGFARGRVFAGDSLVFEGVLVPFFRRGWFDQRDEPTSPFNLVKDAVMPAGVVLSSPDVRHDEPAATWSNLSGGGRVQATIGRLDIAAAVYRGFEAFGPITFEAGVPSAPGSAVVGELVEWHSRFTMVSGDFETVHGEWAIRGEVAAFVERRFASVGRPGLVDGRSLDAGAGVDRRAGDFRVFGSVILHRDWSDVDPDLGDTDVSLVGSIERPFNRDRWLTRAFAVVNPVDRSTFIRGLVTWTPRDNVSVEASGGAFLGTGDDAIGRFKGRDFVFGRVKYHF